LQQALAKDPQNTEVIANMIVLNVIGGKDPKELTRYGYSIGFKTFAF
jgi:coatomer protein complex subunit epsilon